MRYPPDRNLHTFQIGFKMKCTRNGDMPTAFTISLIVYMPPLPTITLTFETFALLVITNGRPDIAASWMHYLLVRNNFLHLRTVFTHYISNSPRIHKKKAQRAAYFYCALCYCEDCILIGLQFRTPRILS